MFKIKHSKYFYLFFTVLVFTLCSKMWLSFQPIQVVVKTDQATTEPFELEYRKISSKGDKIKRIQSTKTDNNKVYFKISAKKISNLTIIPPPRITT